MKKLMLTFVLGAALAAAQSLCNTSADNGRSIVDGNGVSSVCFYPVFVTPPSTATTTLTPPVLLRLGRMAWHKYTVAFIANGTADCTAQLGCITVNNSPSVFAKAALTQAVSLFDSSDVYINGARVKTGSACSGASTVKLTGLGDTLGSATRYVTGATYDLTAAVSTTNFAFLTIANNFSTTTGTDTITATITTTGTNVNTVVAGCSFDLEILWGSLPF